MGILRTIFALTVVLAHTLPKHQLFIGGRNAVQLFYIISGFLISYVLIETKRYKHVRFFYLSRYLRLYPVYLTVVLFTLISYLFVDHHAFTTVYLSSPPEAIGLLLLSNIFILGQDWVMFSGIENQHLVFSTNFYESDVVLYSGLVAPQAWTLGLELSFYLLAPLILHRRKVIYLLLMSSIALRFYLYRLGLATEDPWTYRFFPTELAFFLCGALAHQLLLPLYVRLLADKLIIASRLATSLLLVGSLCYFLIPLRELHKEALLFTGFILLVPLAFVFQNTHPWDSWIGSLSYPIYIVHVLVISLVFDLFAEGSVSYPFLAASACVLGSILSAIILNRLVTEPFEKFRKRLRSVTQ